MILKGFCLRCSASSRTTIGGLIVMTLASAGNAIFGAIGSGLAGGDLAPGENLAPGKEGPLGGGVPRTLRISPRLVKSVRFGSGALGGSLTVGTFSGGLGPALGGN